MFLQWSLSVGEPTETVSRFTRVKNRVYIYFDTRRHGVSKSCRLVRNNVVGGGSPHYGEAAFAPSTTKRTSTLPYDHLGATVKVKPLAVNDLSNNRCNEPKLIGYPDENAVIIRH